ncbi:MAG: Mth938-like domain-containing protein [Thiomicrorhabdus sp.]|nr:Mth938-like domain-containing protein [Thiomicrorhabdus sp.]MCF6298258.1 Mth938-like domain-containing protein [Thiomicrorhabdus sp.]
MKFTEHRDSNVFAVKNYAPNKVKVNQFIFTKSFFITQFSTEKDWPCEHIEQLTLERMDQLLNTKAEVIILGTGEQQIFPPPQLFAYCAAKGVGLEVMANNAACRTYNVLTSEDREVALALILEPNA